MKLIEKKDCYLLEDIYQKNIILGFTKTTIYGKNPPQDIKKAISFLPFEFKTAYLNQIHSAVVHNIVKPGIYEGDGLFTELNNCVLIVKTADCLPLIFVSEELGVIGVVHMGWRSAKEGILGNISYDLSTFKVIAGVAMRKCCYGVGDEFLDYLNFRNFLTRKNKKLYFDPISFAYESLINNGLKKENFIDLDICSFHSPQNFFSYRRDKQFFRTLSFVIKI